MRQTYRTGFTLVECLIVIAIILLLASLLFPVFARARRSSQRVICLNNLRQLHLAFMMHVTDHDEMFPATENPALWMGRNWRPVIDAYVGNRKMYWCPVDATAKLKYDATSYAYLQTFYFDPAAIDAGVVTGFRTCDAPIAAQSLGSVAHPAQKILIYEWFTNHEAPQRTMWDSTGLHAAVFVDGHAAFVRQEALRLSVLNDRDPNWTVGGVGGKDID